MYSLSSVTYSLSSGSVQHGGRTQSRDRRTPPDPHQRNSCLGVSIVALLHDDASTTLLWLLGLLLVPPVMFVLNSVHTTSTPLAHFSQSAWGQWGASLAFWQGTPFLSLGPRLWAEQRQQFHCTQCPHEDIKKQPYIYDGKTTVAKQNINTGICPFIISAMGQLAVIRSTDGEVQVKYRQRDKRE